jgi:hypothetical protein
MSDDRFIAKEISRLEMDALTKFAPAYFEYTKNAIQGQVRNVVTMMTTTSLSPASYCSCEDLWVFQDRVSQCNHRSYHAHERAGDGESFL